MKRLLFLMFFLLLLLSLTPASATTIYTGTIIADSGFYSSYPSINAVNQSGLSDAYISGVTDFDTYAALNPTHMYSSYTTGGALDNLPVFIDLDFGEALTFTDFGLWNDNDYQGIKEFNILVADNASFTGATSLGSFTATYGPPGYSNPIDLQLFDLDDATGRYVRLNILSAHSSSIINFGEIIFGAETPAPVPEPATMILLGSGLVGFTGLRKKFKKN